MTATDDALHMSHALGLAARGLGQTWPNPSVGCVLVKDGRIIGRGWTQAGGRPHAEVMALAQAGSTAQGSTAFVTLEPCAHHGHTPPCAEALIAAGVARVVTALTDPDPRVSGRGHAALRAAEIAVTEGVLTPEATRLNAGFLKRLTQGLPFLTLKLAASLDGRIATSTGQSRWITGAQARRRVHLMRMTHDAVMVGSGTARADDPELTIRDIGGTRQPVRIVVDSHLTHQPASKLGQTARDAPVWLLHTPAAPPDRRDAWTATGARLIEVPVAPSGKTDLAAALKILANAGLTRILCEGGAALGAALLAASLVDDIAVFSAGTLIGGDGHPMLAPFGVTTLASAPRPRLISRETLGEDLLSLWSL